MALDMAALQSHPQRNLIFAGMVGAALLALLAGYLCLTRDSKQKSSAGQVPKFKRSGDVIVTESARSVPKDEGRGCSEDKSRSPASSVRSHDSSWQRVKPEGGALMASASADYLSEHRAEGLPAALRYLNRYPSPPICLMCGPGRVRPVPVEAEGPGVPMTPYVYNYKQTGGWYRGMGAMLSREAPAYNKRLNKYTPSPRSISFKSLSTR